MSDFVRPSELARTWGKNPRTITTWIREGKLAAVRSPGNHFRLRAADVRAFCAREGLPLPPSLAAPPGPKLLVLGAAAPLRRALERALAGRPCAIEHVDDAQRGLLSAVLAPPTALAVNAAIRTFDAESAVRALRATPPTAALPVLAFNVATRARCGALVRAGATRAVGRGRGQLVADEIALLLGR